MNINAARFDLELERAKEKVDCGVSAFLTQPVLSERAALNLEQARKTLGGAKLIGGLFPVVSEKNARFLQSEVHGITVDDVVVRAYAGLDREQGEALGRSAVRSSGKADCAVYGRLLHHDPIPARGACVPRDACDPEFGRIRA